MFLHVESKIVYLVWVKTDRLVFYVYIYIECVCLFKFKSCVQTPALLRLAAVKCSVKKVDCLGKTF